jgi:hypothetical protein
MVKVKGLKKPVSFMLAALIVWAVTPALAQEEEGTAEGGGTGGEYVPTEEGKAGVEDTGGLKKIGEGGVLEMEEVIIEGRLERPVGLFLKRQDPDLKKVRVEKSFWDDILQPIDKEEFEKAVRETKFDFVKNPFLWASTSTTILAGAASGYQYYTGEKTNATHLAIVCGSAAATTLILIIIDKARAPEVLK